MPYFAPSLIERYDLSVYAINEYTLGLLCSDDRHISTLRRRQYMTDESLRRRGQTIKMIDGSIRSPLRLLSLYVTDNDALVLYIIADGSDKQNTADGGQYIVLSLLCISNNATNPHTCLTAGIMLAACVFNPLGV
eukprot:scaffold10085_cov23-Prasinocladus_malaysianus.AAC.1